jgi:hypothetical protein
MPFLVCELTSVFFQLLNSRLEGEVRALLAAARKDKESMALAYENTISELRAQVDATLAVNQTTSVDRAIDSSQPNEASATPQPRHLKLLRERCLLPSQLLRLPLQEKKLQQKRSLSRKRRRRRGQLQERSPKLSPQQKRQSPLQSLLRRASQRSGQRQLRRP